MTMTQLIRANELVREGPFLAPKLTLMIDLMTLYCVCSVCAELLVADFWVIGALIFRIGHGLCNAHHS